ncbi:MAG: hypothetical protein ORN58_03685 [Sediminibacterium sp.]|nr:hypothetical protein [Sediminibacterium sp.]
MKKTFKISFLLFLSLIGIKHAVAQSITVVNGTISPSSANVYYGDSLRFTYNPNRGCLLDSIIVNGINIGKDSLSTYTLRNITPISSLRVVYKRQTFGIYQKTVLRRPNKPDSINIKNIGNSNVDTNIVLKGQIDLPITFDLPNVDYTLTDFEGAISKDTILNGNHVVKTIKPTGAQPWAGTTIGSDKNGSKAAIKTPFSNASAPRLSVLVKSPAAGLKVRVKIEDANDNTKSVETDASTLTTANNWDTLIFNFANFAAGTSAWNPAYTYNKISIFFDFLGTANDKVFYWDDVKLLPAVIVPPIAFSPDTALIRLLTNNSSRTWKIDTSVAVYFGVGDGNTFYPDWYQANGGDSKASTFPCIGSGATTFTFDAATKAVKVNFVQNGGVFVVNDALSFYSLSGGDQCSSTLTVTPNNPITFAAATSASTPAISTRTQFTVGGNGIVNLGTGSTTYEILTINNSQLYLRAIIGGSGNAWYQRLRPTDGAVVNPPPPVVNTKSKMDFPITFDDTANVNYEVTNFGRVLTKDSTISNNRLKATTKPANAETWGGTTLGAGLTPTLKYALSNTGAPKFSVLVKSPAAGLTIKMKIETENNLNGSTVGEFVEKDVTSLTANGWDSLVFDFSTGTTGTWNAAKTYTRLSIFFDFGAAGSGKIFLWDNVRLLGYAANNINPPVVNTKEQISLPITFDSANVDYTVVDFEGAATSDTTVLGNKAKKTIKTVGAQTWAGTTMGNNSVVAGALKTAFSNAAAPRLTVRVYVPDTGIRVRLKIESASDNTKTVETDAISTSVGWQTLSFNFANAATNDGNPTAAWSASYTYNKLSIFFDYGKTGDGRLYIWDDVKLAQ